MTRAEDLDLVRQEFPDYPLESIPADIPEWLRAECWHHDACPIWRGHGISLAIQHPSPEMRERADFGDPDPRYFVCRGPQSELLELTEDWSVALAKLRELW